MIGTKKRRADVYLVETGFFESRARAQDAIAAGLVTADGAVLAKASQLLSAEARIEASQPHPYVSRGGVKLAAALDHFGIDPAGRIALDIGASTGGFTDALLKRGAQKVFAVDTGHGQLHASLRADARVVSMESRDARGLDAAALATLPTLVVIDVSFISLALILPHAARLSAPGAELIALIKPQFEAGRAHLKKGIVRDEAVRREVCARIKESAEQAGFAVTGIIASPIAGGDGNIEFLMAGGKRE